jgi:hypothetical protein
MPIARSRPHRKDQIHETDRKRSGLLEPSRRRRAPAGQTDIETGRQQRARLARAAVLRKREQEVKFRKSDPRFEGKEERTPMHTQSEIYELAADINKRVKDPRERDVLLTRLHRAEKGEVNKLGGGNLPTPGPGRMLETFNDGDREWPVPPTAAEFMEELAGKYMRLDPNLKKSTALEKAMQDPKARKMYESERDAQLLAATKLYG